MFFRKKNKFPEIKFSKELVDALAFGACLGFLDFLKNREVEFYKQLNKMRIK